ncbi:MAG TPA: CocE/NonD family hydrolase [Pyrinomonadaceae bacterium]
MRLKITLLFAFVLTIALHGYASAQAPVSQPAHTVTINFNQRVRMRDGVELSADVYRPDSAGQFPVILSRTPYIKTSASTLAIARYFVPRGYVFVAMDVRGRGDSDGKFVPYRNDGRTGLWSGKCAIVCGVVGSRH